MIARYKRSRGFDVYFMTGSDEHGQKIEEKAKALGVSPKEFVDGVSSEIKKVWDSMNTTYDKFIRTTDDYHEKTVQKIFKKLYEKGDIYKGSLRGQVLRSLRVVLYNVAACGRQMPRLRQRVH